MRKNGFTLIELLAVIVILAIIALIATPIILGIINDAREESNERSIELYASAVRNGIAAYQLRTWNEVLPGTYNKDNELPFEVEYDGKVDCENIIISEDGKVSLDKCTVNGGTKEYSYGIEENSTAKICELSDEDSNGKYSVGDIVTCTFEESIEQFYVIEDEDDDSTEGMSMLAMYNLYVGNSTDADSYEATPLENPTGIQNPLAKGYLDGDAAFYGTVAFSTSDYWSSSVSGYPEYVYNESSNLYQYVSAYETYLKENGVESASATLISYEQLDYLQCSGDDYSCSDAPEWVYSTTYWTGSAYDTDFVWDVSSRGGFNGGDYVDYTYCGVRPVITISTSDIQ